MRCAVARAGCWNLGRYDPRMEIPVISVDWSSASVVPSNRWDDGPHTLLLTVSPSPDKSWWSSLEEISTRHARPWKASPSDTTVTEMKITGLAPGSEEDVQKWLEVLISDTNKHFAEKVRANFAAAEKASAESHRKSDEARQMTERFRDPEHG